MSNYPTNTNELLTRIETEWDQLLAVVDQLSPETLTVPAEDGWSPKDQLAHLAHWEQWLLRHHMAGEPVQDVMQVDAQLLEEFDVDRVNDIILARSQERSLAAVLEELHRGHAQVVNTLTALPFADLLRPHYADDPANRPLLGWVAGDTYEHYQEHREILERLLD